MTTVLLDEPLQSSQGDQDKAGKAEYDRLAASPVWARTLGKLSGVELIADLGGSATKVAY